MNTKSNSHNLAAMIPVERVQKIPGHVESCGIWFIRKSKFLDVFHFIQSYF